MSGKVLAQWHSSCAESSRHSLSDECQRPCFAASVTRRVTSTLLNGVGRGSQRGPAVAYSNRDAQARRTSRPVRRSMRAWRCSTQHWPRTFDKSGVSRHKGAQSSDNSMSVEALRLFDSGVTWHTQPVSHGHGASPEGFAGGNSSPSQLDA